MKYKVLTRVHGIRKPFEWSFDDKNEAVRKVKLLAVRGFTDHGCLYTPLKIWVENSNGENMELRL